MASRAELVTSGLTPAEALYMDDGGPKRCDRCVMWVANAERCTIHGPRVPVLADMVCGLYVHGPVTSLEQAEVVARVTPGESGLGWGDTTCGNCRYGDGAPECGHPAFAAPFPISAVGGCCNFWKARPGEPSRELRRAGRAAG